MVFKRLASHLIILILLIGCTGCSWNYQFIIENATSQSIQIIYKLTSLDEAGIFKNKVNIINKNKEIKEHANLFDQDSMVVSVELPADSKAIIGHGRNTKYKWYKFINTKSEELYFTPFFNLDYLEIKTSKGTIKASHHMIETLITKDNTVETKIKID